MRQLSLFVPNEGTPEEHRMAITSEWCVSAEPMRVRDWRMICEHVLGVCDPTALCELFHDDDVADDAVAVLWARTVVAAVAKLRSSVGWAPVP